MLLDQYPEQKNYYFQLLQAISSLSRLFSDNDVPALYYRASENIFCKAFQAYNLSRSDVAYDAKLNTWGIGLKTFTSPNGNSLEKIAEFNKLSNELSVLSGSNLAVKLALLRNERINIANRLYGINNACYHCIAREKGRLKIFETPYTLINIDKLKKINKTKSGISFEDDTNEYRYNISKSTLYKRFITPNRTELVNIDIIKDPFELLLSLISNQESDENYNSNPYIILPLYATQKSPKQIPKRSGLNQWNAKGRPRDAGEMYVPVPRKIHKYFPEFFPPRDVSFQLQVPTGEILNAKLCQDGSKALMTNPNNALSEWLLRYVLNLKELELATYEHLEIAGFDSLMIQRINKNYFKIDVAGIDSYEKFIYRY